MLGKITLLLDFRRWAGIPSGPVALRTFNPCSAECTSSSRRGWKWNLDEAESIFGGSTLCKLRKEREAEAAAAELKWQFRRFARERPGTAYNLGWYQPELPFS